MEFRNYTPFPALAFQMLDWDENEYHVVAMRATLDIQEDGSLQFSEEQAPLAVTDEYFGEMNKSSVRQESDLAPFKPKCDVIVNATAYAPGGKSVPSFEVGIRITGQSGQDVVLEKTLTVTGTRYWKENDNQWKLTEPEPIESLPLRYEYAYGGECRIEKEDPATEKLDPQYFLTPEQRAEHPAGPDNAPAAHAVCATNPVGLGFTEPWYLEATRPEPPPSPRQSHKQPTPRRGFMKRLIDRLLFLPPLPEPAGDSSPLTAESREIPAPQIESPHDPILEFGKKYVPQGFGVITKAWRPRLELAGTYDRQWLDERWPKLPEDFDFAYWNCAHPDLQIPWLKGKETMELTNLTPGGKLSIQLPGHLPYVLVRYENGDIGPAPAHLDTLILEPDTKRATLVWRTTVAVEPEVRVLEARLIRKEDTDELSTAVREAING